MAGIKAPLADILSKIATMQVLGRDGQMGGAYVRMWNNQLHSEMHGKMYDFPKPAFFVEIITPVTFQEIGGNFRGAELAINVHIVHECMDAGNGTFEQDMEVFDLRDKIVALLGQYRPTGCGQMTAINEMQDYDHDNLYHYIVGLVCNFTDSKSSPYDPVRNNYVDSTPPTDLQIDVTKADLPIYESPQPFKIPK